MRAIAHGWTPSRMESPPSRAVAQEFVDADRKYSGGFAENRYWTGGLAPMSNVNAGYKGRIEFQRGGRRGGRRRDGGAGTSTTTYSPPPAPAPVTYPWGTEPGTSQEMLGRMGYSGPMGYIGVVSGLRQAGWTAAPGSDPGDLRNTMWYPPEDTFTGGGGPGGPSGPPPRIIQSDPASYVGTTAPSSREGSEYRKDLRKHQRRIEKILGSARGGHVNYYEEGGTVRPGHAEGPNPFEGRNMPGSYARWERENHIDPPPPPEPEPEPEEVPWYKKLIGYGTPTKTDEALAEMEQAYGGRVNYQAGGLAIAAPAGGVPPWIEPVGSGPGFSDEPPGYQFGGAARGYRGVPPQRGGIRRGGGQPRRGGFRSRFQQQRGAVPGGAVPTRGFRGMAARGELGPGTTTRYRDGMPIGGGPAPTGGLAAILQQYQQQRAGAAGGLPPGVDPRAVAANPEGYARQQAEWARRGVGEGFAPGAGPGAGQGILPGEMRGPMGPVNIVDPTTGESTPYWGPGGQEGYEERVRRMQRGPLAPGGGPLQPGRVGTLGGPGYGEYPLGSAGPRMDPSDPRYRAGPPPGSTFAPGEGIPGGGNIPPWKQRSRIAPPPGPGPGDIPGGPRVPPNMRGYLQKMRMQNRPPSGPVGGGGNRVGMQDQQGALSRALQRGTGRPPMSRRSAFGRAQ